ncbi:terminase small subunit [Candidatus Pacearchaeota archaeon]|nr:terminase small subunit [Candidatus Pacearchaeota archaeon]
MAKEETPQQKLNLRQEKFAIQYSSHFNATKAAKEAGYSEKSARQQGSENLSKPYIKDRIKEIVDSKISDERIKNELANIAFSDITDIVDKTGRLKPLEDLTPEQRACISEISETHGVVTHKKTLKLHNKLPALSKLVEIKGLVKTKIEHSGEIKGGVLVVKEIPSMEDWVKDGE